MINRLAVTVAIAAVAVGVVAGAASAHRGAAHPKLVGTVGQNDAYKITLRTSAGKLVKTIPAGTYTVVIHDDSAIHNYELDGPHGKSWSFTEVRSLTTPIIGIRATCFRRRC